MPFLIIIILIIIFIVISNESIKDQLSKPRYLYRKKDYLLSISEKSLYRILEKIAKENNFLLFSKVRLEDLLWIPKGISQKERFSLRQRIKSRHVDFLICDEEKISPLLAIELDDSSHESRKGVERDNFVNKALEVAKLPLLRIKVRKYYDFSLISQKIKESINIYEKKN